MRRNYRAEAEKLLAEFEKSRQEDFKENEKMVEKWNKENPNPTKAQFSKFDADFQKRLLAYYEADQKRFGKSFMKYILDAQIRISLEENKISSRRKSLTKKQIQALEKREHDILVSGVMKLLRSGKVEPLKN